jgi:hypothetical protein
MSPIVLAIAVSVAVTATVFIVYILWTHRDHRGAHARHHDNLSGAALASQPAYQPETYHEFLERMRHHQLRRDNPDYDQNTGRHHVVEPDTGIGVRRERSDRHAA